MHLAGIPNQEIADKLGVTIRTVFRALADSEDERITLETLIEECGVDSMDAHIKLSKMFDADLKDIFNDDWSLKPLKQWPEIWRTGLAGELKIEDIMVRSEDGGNSSWDVSAGKKVTLKRADAIKVIELLMRHKSVDAIAQPKNGDTNINITVTAQQQRLSRARQRIEKIIEIEAKSEPPTDDTSIPG